MKNVTVCDLFILTLFPEQYEDWDNFDDFSDFEMHYEGSKVFRDVLDSNQKAIDPVFSKGDKKN